jgi:biopolymer transport protein TolQ
MPPGGQRLSPHYATDAARDRVRSERQEPAMDPTQAPIEAAHDFSFLGLFLQADPIVKGVMILLVIASIACWTVVFEKVIRLSAARRQAKAFATLVRSGGSLDGDHRGIAGHVVKAAIDAWRDQDSSETRAERRERIERAMKGALTLEMKRLRTGLSLLATSGSTAPFVGLFGTVWGIMNSFSSIARSQDTSLAVVAPGIAEALFATAIGLVVAIPAVMAYNKLAADIGGVQSTFGSYISVLGNRLARDRAGAHRAAAE